MHVFTQPSMFCDEREQEAAHLGIPKGTFLSSLIQDVGMQGLQYCIERELALLISTVHELKSFSFIIPIELIIVVFFMLDA